MEKLWSNIRLGIIVFLLLSLVVCLCLSAVNEAEDEPRNRGKRDINRIMTAHSKLFQPYTGIVLPLSVLQPGLTPPLPYPFVAKPNAHGCVGVGVLSIRNSQDWDHFLFIMSSSRIQHLDSHRHPGIDEMTNESVTKYLFEPLLLHPIHVRVELHRETLEDPLQVHKLCITPSIETVLAQECVPDFASASVTRHQRGMYRLPQYIQHVLEEEVQAAFPGCRSIVVEAGAPQSLLRHLQHKDGGGWYEPDIPGCKVESAITKMTERTEMTEMMEMTEEDRWGLFEVNGAMGIMLKPNDVSDSLLLSYADVLRQFWWRIRVAAPKVLRSPIQCIRKDLLPSIRYFHTVQRQRRALAPLSFLARGCVQGSSSEGMK